MHDERKKDEKKKRIERIIRIVIIVVALVGIIGGTYKFITFKMDVDGQLVLGEARIIRIALNQEKIDLYASSKTLADPTTDTGFTKSIIAKVKELRDYDGELHLIKCTADGKEVLKMTYTSGHYVAEYDAERADGDAWKVYFMWRLDHLL